MPYSFIVMLLDLCIKLYLVHFSTGHTELKLGRERILFRNSYFRKLTNASTCENSLRELILYLSLIDRMAIVLPCLSFTFLLNESE